MLLSKVCTEEYYTAGNHIILKKSFWIPLDINASINTRIIQERYKLCEVFSTYAKFSFRSKVIQYIIIIIHCHVYDIGLSFNIVVNSIQQDSCEKDILQANKCGMTIRKFPFPCAISGSQRRTTNFRMQMMTNIQLGEVSEI